MSREEFMRQLERLLKDVAEEERKEALSYYQSYFEDAGVENEARILRELESPEKVAATIKTDLGMETGPESIKTDLGMETDTGVFTEHGFEDSRFEQKHPISIRKPAGGQQSGAGIGKEQHSGDSSRAESSQSQFSGDTYDYEEQESSGYEEGKGFAYGEQRSSGYGEGKGFTYEEQKSGYSNSGDGRSTYSGRSGMEILLIIAIAVITSPIWLGVITGLGGSVFGMAIAAVCTAGALYISGGVLFGIGIGQFITGNLAVGFALTGVGLLLLALAILATVLCVWVCGKLVPWICGVISRLWRSIFSGKEQRA